MTVHIISVFERRSAKDRLPEECMVCPKIVQCMLKGVTGWVVRDIHIHF